MKQIIILSLIVSIVSSHDELSKFVMKENHRVLETLFGYKLAERPKGTLEIQGSGEVNGELKTDVILTKEFKVENEFTTSKQILSHDSVSNYLEVDNLILESLDSLNVNNIEIRELL